MLHERSFKTLGDNITYALSPGTVILVKKKGGSYELSYKFQKKTNASRNNGQLIGFSSDSRNSLFYNVKKTEDEETRTFVFEFF